MRIPASRIPLRVALTAPANRQTRATIPVMIGPASGAAGAILGVQIAKDQSPRMAVESVNVTIDPETSSSSPATGLRTIADRVVRRAIWPADP